MRIVSWNVNGLRAIMKKGFIEWIEDFDPEILCLQETKLQDDQIPPEINALNEYVRYYSFAERKGYSGVAVFSKKKPEKVETKFGIERFDNEGRNLIIHYKEFTLINIYYPNGQMSHERLDYKMAFYDAFLDFANSLIQKGKKLIICGDFNTAHHEIDLARPKENENRSGFLPIERTWMDKFVKSGYIDTFRMFVKESGHYSWWDYKTRARERNIGWRIDYFFVSRNFKDKINKSFILEDVMGSDHCPVGIEIS